MHLDANNATTFVIEAANDAYTIKHSGRNNNVGGNSDGHARMYDDCTNSNNYTFEAVEGGVKIKDAANYYICFDQPKFSLYLKNDVAGSVFRLVSAEQYTNSIVTVTYKLNNLSGQEVSHTMKALLDEKVVAPYIPFFTQGTVTDDDKTVTAEKKTFQVTGTWDFPFEQGKYYTMKSSNSTGNFVYNGINAYCNNTVDAALDNDKWSFEHVANSVDLFKVKNEKGGYATVASTNNQTLVTFSATPTDWKSDKGESSYFRITKNATNQSGFNLQHPGDANANAGNHVSGALGFWTNGASSDNNGSCIIITEAELTGVADYKTQASAEVDAWYLASDEVIGNAKSAINAAANREAVNTALANGYTAYNNEISEKCYWIQSAYPNYWEKQQVAKAFIAGESKVTWGTFDSSNPYQYFEISVTTTGHYNIKSCKVNKYMTATNGTLGASPTNNTILKRLDNGQYNIVVGSGNPCHTEGHSEGAGVSGNIVAWAGEANSCSAWTFTGMDKSAYDAANGRTIYYTITDGVGTQYTGSFVGGKGEMPPFTGVTGQTYQNAVWDIADGNNLTLTANIIFPFPVSKVGTDNWTYIGSFQSENGLWYSKENTLRMKLNSKPTNETNSNEAYMWAIYPTFNEGKFTFKIKNALGGYLAGTNISVDNTFALNAEGRDYTYAIHLTNKKGFYDEENGKFITINSSSTTGEQNAWLWTANGTTHNGSNLNFYAPADFASLMEKLTGRYNNYGEGLGKYSSTEENKTNAEHIVNGTDYATAAQITTMTNGFTLNMPARNKFYRLKGQTGRYVCSDVVDKSSSDQGLYTMKDLDGNEKKTIFYLSDDSHLINYETGMSFSWGWKSSLLGADHDCTWTISEADAAIGKYIIECPNNSTWVGQKYLGDVTNQSYLNRQSEKNSNCYWTIEEVVDLPITIAASGYTTFYAPVNMQVAEGVSAYTADVDDDNAHVQFEELADGKIPAGTGVLIKGKDATTISVINESLSSTDSDLNGAPYTVSYALNDNTGYNALMGGESISWHAYTLQSGTWKRYSGTKLTGFKAHLELEDINSTGAAKAYTFGFGEEGETTGIVEALGMQENNAPIYDLSGRRIQKAQKGLYIVNGKKVMVK